MKNIFIFHGTEGYPGENWFPWMKQKLERRGCRVFVPQFPSPPVVPAKISEWFEILEKYKKYIEGFKKQNRAKNIRIMQQSLFNILLIYKNSFNVSKFFKSEFS